ncbi:MAG: lipoyl(octanoyl) transferase LipB [Bdellovibrionales bacterium]|nr:lipoyl(octanoyl) transferase LipB [Bdellovibrionales bacterium]
MIEPERPIEFLREPAMLAVEDWGLVSYKEALSRQEEYVDQVARELRRETLVFCSHPPVVTLGRGTKPGDVFGWTGETYDVSRGGRATYHGPSQIVAYPILDLNSRGRDLHLYMRKLEVAVLETLRSFGISAEANALQIEDGAVEAAPATGVWIGEKKIASIGIAVRKWISFHGLALNVSADPLAFGGMKPCGFAPGSVISMEDVLGVQPNLDTVRARLETELLKQLSDFCL